MQTPSNQALYEDTQAKVKNENPALSPEDLESATKTAYETAYARYFGTDNPWNDFEKQLDDFFAEKMAYQANTGLKWRPMANKEDNNK